ncbi:MAG TPA: acetate/propionate family kinase [Acidimicrobiales bacterium]|nr:acetate/propionate family kinase [Acidimicrobiales bacterium]
MRVLVVNAGSSSLKLRLLGSDDEVLFTDSQAHQGRFDPGTVETAITSIAGQVDAVGHRVVHGGTTFTAAVVIDAAVERALRLLADLAPLHQPKSLAGIDVVRDLLPDVPAVACFDTAFHATMPAAAATYAVPAVWRERYGVRRYGFHGLSHAYASRRAAELIGRPVEQLRIVTCHLGAGASLAAVRHGRSVDTTMGFTPLEGLVMATRSGTIDPGLVTWLLQNTEMTVDQVADALEHTSGLLALSGSSDMAAVEEGAVRGDTRCRLAVGVYLHRLRAGIASMASAMDGLDALAFTGGVGENAASIRAGAVAGLGFLGTRIDERANAGPALDADITAAGSRVRTVVVEAREDLQIAAEVRSLLRRSGG